MTKDKKDIWKQQQEYSKNNYFHYHLKIRKDEAEIIAKLNSVASKNGYITELIRKDIENENNK